MSELTQQKFLDAEGLKYLWKKISLEDYPNNATLLAVLEAINEEIEAINNKMSINHQYGWLYLDPNSTSYVFECQVENEINCNNFSEFPLGYHASIIIYNPWNDLDTNFASNCLKDYSDIGIAFTDLSADLMFNGAKLDIYKSDETGKFNWNISLYPHKAEESEF